MEHNTWVTLDEYQKYTSERNTHSSHAMVRMSRRSWTLECYWSSWRAPDDVPTTIAIQKWNWHHSCRTWHSNWWLKWTCHYWWSYQYDRLPFVHLICSTSSLGTSCLWTSWCTAVGWSWPRLWVLMNCKKRYRPGPNLWNRLDTFIIIDSVPLVRESYGSDSIV